VHDEDTMEAVLVKVVNPEQEAAALFGSWVKHSFSELRSRQILPEDVKRKRAVIIVSGPVDDIVYIGAMAQVDNLNVAQASAGEIVITGTPTNTGTVTFEVQSSTEQWVLPSSVDCLVSVLIERYL
jgi:hypothetical protein